MPTKKSSRRSASRKRSSHASHASHASQSSKILPPLDVRSSSSLKELQKRIKNGPITIMMIYADWCGHCHEIMPHWDKAAASSNRSIQAIKVNEQMLPHVNRAVNNGINRSAAPIEVEGYPSIILVDNQGNKVTDVQPVKDSVVLSKAMNQVGSVAKEAEMVEEPPSLTRNQNSNSAVPMNVNPPLVPGTNVNRQEEEEWDQPMAPSLAEEGEKGPGQGVSLYAENPPSITGSKEMTPYNKVRGGSSLYASLSQSAYTLAPAATLLGMAALVMKHHVSTKRGNRKKGSNRKKGGNRQGKTMKRRKH